MFAIFRKKTGVNIEIYSIHYLLRQRTINVIKLEWNRGIKYLEIKINIYVKGFIKLFPRKRDII